MIITGLKKSPKIVQKQKSWIFQYYEFHSNSYCFSFTVQSYELQYEPILLLKTDRTSGWSRACYIIGYKTSVTSLFACRSIISMTAVLKRTTSSSLQLQLERWVALVDTAISHTNPSVERSDAILAFCKVFVPADVSEDDIDHFCGMLTTDEVKSLCKQKNDYV